MKEIHVRDMTDTVERLCIEALTPPLLIRELGLKGMIGKGSRSQEVIKAMKQYGAIYFLAIGGAGALLTQRIKKAEVIAYEDLGPEAIYQLEVEDFPLIVGIDCRGRNTYEEGKVRYRAAVFAKSTKDEMGLKPS